MNAIEAEFYFCSSSSSSSSSSSLSSGCVFNTQQMTLALSIPLLHYRAAAVHACILGTPLMELCVGTRQVFCVPRYTVVVLRSSSSLHVPAWPGVMPDKISINRPQRASCLGVLSVQRLRWPNRDRQRSVRIPERRGVWFYRPLSCFESTIVDHVRPVGEQEYASL